MATFLEAVEWMKEGYKTKCRNFTYHLDGSDFHREDNCNADFDLPDIEGEWILVPSESNKENKLQNLINKHKDNINMSAMFGYSIDELSNDDLKACAIEGFSLYHKLLKGE